MAGVVKGMDATLKSMNLEKVEYRMLISLSVSFVFLLSTSCRITKQCLNLISSDFRSYGQIWAPVWNPGCSDRPDGGHDEQHNNTNNTTGTHVPAQLLFPSLFCPEIKCVLKTNIFTVNLTHFTESSGLTDAWIGRRSRVMFTFSVPVFFVVE